MRGGRMVLLALSLLGVLALMAEPVRAQDDAAPPEAHLLRLNFAEGEQLTYRMELNGVGSFEVMGNTQQIAVDGTMDLNLKVEEITEGGNYQILTTLDAAGLLVTVNGQVVPVTQALPQIRSVVTPRGQMVSLEMVGESTPGQVDQQIGRILTAENFKNLLQVQKTAAFPEEPVAPGTRWSSAVPEDEVAVGQTRTTLTTEYVCDQEFDGVPCARLETEAVIGVGVLGELAETLGMTGATNATGTTWFDYAAGRTRATEERTQVTINLTVPAAMTNGAGDVGVFMEMFMEARSWLLPPVEENAEEAEAMDAPAGE